jgi:hypothetical protein
MMAATRSSASPSEAACFEYNMLGNKLRQRQVSNDLIGYFDLTYGRDRGFLSYAIERTTTDGKPADLSAPTGLVTITSAMQPRWSIEARLKIPFLPALIGVDANIRTNTRVDEPNLLRFVVAFRIDAQKALARVFGSVK